MPLGTHAHTHSTHITTRVQLNISPVSGVHGETRSCSTPTGTVHVYPDSGTARGSVQGIRGRAPPFRQCAEPEGDLDGRRPSPLRSAVGGVEFDGPVVARPLDVAEEDLVLLERDLAGSELREQQQRPRGGEALEEVVAV